MQQINAMVITDRSSSNVDKNKEKKYIMTLADMLPLNPKMVQDVVTLQSLSVSISKLV